VFHLEGSNEFQVLGQMTQLISKRGRFKEVYNDIAKKVLGEKMRVSNNWIGGKTYRIIKERQGLKRKIGGSMICLHEGESHCCICSEGQGGESQHPGTQVEMAE